MFIFTIPLLSVLSILFTNLYHPLAMGLLLLIQTILISITIGLTTYSFWFSYILFLVFLGGMLILFIYVASLASNEPFMFKLSSMMLISFMTLTPLIMLLSDPISHSSNILLSQSSLEFMKSTNFITSWIYNSPSMMFTIYIVSYLLLTLIVVVKIVNLFKGPLRLMN
uniref:NADH dehydrogenase subunit 6 n=1 Tax=Kroppcarcinus siderastreicola TaxID=1903112 RepID=UPI0028D37E4F|nr:NADH dehydrogenase subunit 6 [Kroppcarcinus siderastreicola]WMY25233.1 NADH dehydrogenase subunit 6 [Kroppcarcinus siderastreicola]